MIRQQTDAVVVGAGIVGLAHAYALAKRGHRVTVIERHPFASSASVRNFGMVWPIGQPLGPMRNLALQSRELWREVCQDAGMWFEACGSLHVAYHEDELQVLNEFAASAGEDVGVVLSPEAALQRAPQLRQEGLLGGLWSPHELCVDPRTAVAEIASYLTTKFDVDFRFGDSALVVDQGEVVTDSARISARAIVVCPGAGVSGVYGPLLVENGMVQVRLQMLRATPKEASYRIGTHLCAGLTSLHYQSFRDCPTLPHLRARLEADHAPLLENGVHVLVSQHADGSVTIGDSHHYGPHHMPYSSEAVDDMILGYLDSFLPTDKLAITQRWEGVYGKHPTEPYLVLKPEPNVFVVGAIGGAGMTLSFGVGEKTVVEEILPVLEKI